MKDKLVVFDWNGTLLSDTMASLKATNDCLAFHKHHPITLAELREHFNFPIIHFYKALGMCVDDILANQDESNKVFQKSYAHHARYTRTRRGARDLLQWLKGQGATSIILSNSRTETIRAHLERLKIAHFFDHISAHHCDGTTILHTTSKHERLEEYMANHGHAPENTIIIGDSTEEPALAKALGLTSIGIMDGSISRQRLRAAQPDYLINHLQESQYIFSKKY